MGHDHLDLFLGWLKDMWYWLAALALVITTVIGWLISKNPFIMMTDLNKCKRDVKSEAAEDVKKLLKEHEDREFSKINAHRAENNEQHVTIHSEITGIRHELSELMRLMIQVSKK